MTHQAVVLYNGTFIDTTKSEVSVPIEERGFQFGDGVYEVIRLYQGTFYTLDQHLTRLYKSLEAVHITLPWSQATLSDLLEELVARNAFTKDGQVYVQVTRGSAPRNHIFPENTPPNIIAYVKEAVRPHTTMQDGVATFLADDIRWLRCDIKSLNLLPNVLAKQAAKEQGGYEAVFHRDGVVTECSSANVYLVKKGIVYTHPANHLILNGITRMQVKHLCTQHNIPFVEKAFTVEEIAQADELFLTSTTSEITPIISVDGRPIQEGVVGPLTRSLQNWFEEDAGITTR